MLGDAAASRRFRGPRWVEVGRDRDNPAPVITPIQVGLTLNAQTLLVLVVVLGLAVFGLVSAVVLIGKAIRHRR